MPSAALLLSFQDDVRVTNQWWIDGTHYARTANQWLASLDAARVTVMPMLRDVHGDASAVWFQRWRMFYMAVAEFVRAMRAAANGALRTIFSRNVPRR